jgi:hypothetical protein
MAARDAAPRGQLQSENKIKRLIFNLAASPTGE